MFLLVWGAWGIVWGVAFWERTLTTAYRATTGKFRAGAVLWLPFVFCPSILFKGVFSMVAKGDPQGKGAAKRASFKPQAQFVRFELTKQEQDRLKQSTFSTEDALEFLMVVLEKGYKVTFRWDDYNHCQACWAIPDDKNPDNSGLILAARGSTALKAVKQLAWLHFEKFKEIWPAPTSREQMEMDD